VEYLAEEGENDRKNDSRFIAYTRSDGCGLSLFISPHNGSPPMGGPFNGFIARD
jgi:hypothetical protein